MSDYNKKLELRALLFDLLKSETLNREQTGKARTFLPVDGQVALLLDKLTRWFDSRNEQELMDFVVDGILLLESCGLAGAIRKNPVGPMSDKLIDFDSLTEEDIRKAITDGGLAQEETDDDGEAEQAKARSNKNRASKKVRPVRKPRQRPRSE